MQSQTPKSNTAMPEATTTAKPKAKGKQRPPRKPIPLPRDADELLAMDRQQVERISLEVAIQLGKTKRRLIELLATIEPDEQQKAHLTGKAAHLGCLMAAVCQRRGAMRGELRRQIGDLPSRDEALAFAVDRIASAAFRERLQLEADKILRRAAKDLQEAA